MTQNSKIDVDSPQDDGVEQPASAADTAEAGPGAAPDAAAAAPEAHRTDEAEPPVEAEPAAAEPVSLEQDLKEEIARLGEENAKLKDQSLRALAEAENTRRRAEREKEDTARYAISGFAKDLLTTADNLRRALDHVPAGAAKDSPAIANLIEGIAATEQGLLSAFEKHGLTRIDPADQRFDPNYHQAMFEGPGTDKLPGTVVQVIQSGFLLNGRLLRPAMVGVAKGEPPKTVDTTA